MARGNKVKRLLGAPGGIASGLQTKSVLKETDRQDDEQSDEGSEDPAGQTPDEREHRFLQRD
jgi:hypothetical protein